MYSSELCLVHLQYIQKYIIIDSIIDSSNQQFIQQYISSIDQQCISSISICTDMVEEWADSRYISSIYQWYVSVVYMQYISSISIFTHMLEEWADSRWSVFPDSSSILFLSIIGRSLWSSHELSPWIGLSVKGVGSRVMMICELGVSPSLLSPSSSTPSLSSSQK